MLLIILTKKKLIIAERREYSLHGLRPLPVELYLFDPLLKLGSIPTVEVFDQHIVAMPTIFLLWWRHVHITPLQIVSYRRDQCAIHHELALRRLVLKSVRAPKPSRLQLLEIACASLSKCRLQFLKLQDSGIFQLCVPCIRDSCVLPCAHSHHV